MKLRYKKIILLTSLSTMGIGLLTLSISTQGRPKAEDNINTASGIVADAQENDDNENNAFVKAANAALDAEPTPEATTETTPIPTPTETPTPTPYPVYPLMEMEGIDAFIEVFYTAKAACDIEKLKTLYYDPSKVWSREELQRNVQYIEEYRNIKTYSKKSFEEGAYIVYAYHEIKFSGINTLAPGLSKFYVITDDDGNFKIVSDLAPEVEEYFNARNEDEDVLELIRTTNAKGEEAKAKDEDLMAFWNGLDELVKSREKQQSGQDSQEPQGDVNGQEDQIGE